MIAVFRYIEPLDGFEVTSTYREVAEQLGLGEWSPVVWIGRYFLMDNDSGEHWFDNWALREQNEARAAELGIDVETLFFIDPSRFVDGRDGPVHSPEARKAFWTDVLRSLRLSLGTLVEEARRMQAERLEQLRLHPGDTSVKDELIPDLERRIREVERRWG